MKPSNQKSPRKFRTTERGIRISTAIVGAVLTILVGHAAFSRLGESLVSLSYDLPFIFHRAGTSDDLRIVYIDQLSGDLLDRRSQARILRVLGESGAKAVIYDIIFDQVSGEPSIDREFADEMRKFRGVDAEGNPIPGAPRRHIMLACGRRNFNTTGMAGEQLIPPIDPLLEAADDFGLVAWDDDGYMIRKLSAGSKDEASLIWKAAVALGTNLDESRRMEPRWINFTGPPSDPGKRPGHVPIPSCMAGNLLLGGVHSGFFRDKVVMIGGEPGIVGEALGDDLFSTPFHRFRIGGKLPLMSGVEMQANGLANFLQGNWLNKSSPDSDRNLILAVGVLLGAGLTLLRPVRSIAAAVVLVIASGLLGCLAMHYSNFWFPWSVVAFAQVPVALVWGIASHSYIERFFRIRISAEQTAIREAFAKYLSPQMLDRLTAEGFNTDLGGEKIEAAMMFTDLEAFTDMCERIGDPQRIVETLNGYFQRTTGSIFDHDGVIIKYIGDAIFAAWGAPLADPDAANKSAHAAWKLFESDKLVVDGESLKTRIGLHFGEVVAGNIGSDRRVDYTLIGDSVNLAARLEGLNKLFDTSILMSDAIYARLDGGFRTRRVGRFRVKGRKEAVVVYELLGPARQDCEPEWIGEYHLALDALDRDQAQIALEHFSSANALRGSGGDGPSRFFMERIQAGEPIHSGVVKIKEK